MLPKAAAMRMAASSGVAVRRLVASRTVRRVVAGMQRLKRARSRFGFCQGGSIAASDFLRSSPCNMNTYYYSTVGAP